MLPFFDGPFSLGVTESQNRFAVKYFTYDMMRAYCDGLIDKVSGASMCCVDIGQENRSWVITITACDSSYEPLVDPCDRHRVVFTANDVDDEFSRFMSGRRRSYYEPNLEKKNSQVKSGGYKEILDVVLKEIVQILKGKSFNRQTCAAKFKFTPHMVNTYRTVPGSSIIIASMRVLGKHTSLLGAIDDNIFLVQEYDNRFGAVVKHDFVELDERVRRVVEEHGGVLVIN